VIYKEKKSYARKKNHLEIPSIREFEMKIGLKTITSNCQKIDIHTMIQMYRNAKGT
jgi:hypothetical protein